MSENTTPPDWAYKIADLIEPGMAKSIAAYTDATHPEIIRGRETLVRARDRIATIIAEHTQPRNP